MTALPHPSPHNVTPIREYTTLNSVDITRTIIGTLGPAYTVYAYLDTYCDANGDAYPSYDRMDDEIAGMGKTTIRRHIDSLVVAGWVIRTERTNKYGMHTGYVYHLPHHTKPAYVQGAKPAPNTNQSETNSEPPQGAEVNTKVSTKVNPSSSSRARKLPEDFVLSDAVRAKAIEYGVPDNRVDFEFEKFCNYYQSTGKSYSDWDAACRNWMQRAIRDYPQKGCDPHAGLSDIQRMFAEQGI